MLTFDKLTEGATLLAHDGEISPAERDEWLTIYPGDAAYGDTVPPGLLLAKVMKVCLVALHDMPDGGIHAGQQLTIRRLPTLGEPLATTIACTAKEMRRGRRYATIAMTTRDGSGATVVEGVNRSIWAA
ncbi:MAG: hypothetical protein RIM84_21745 [Alphaproteobacteria bacterium]